MDIGKKRLAEFGLERELRADWKLLEAMCKVRSPRQGNELGHQICCLESACVARDSSTPNPLIAVLDGRIMKSLQVLH